MIIFIIDSILMVNIVMNLMNSMLTYQVVKLREQLKRIKMSTHGRKVELIERLKSDDAQRKKNGIVKDCRIVLHRISRDKVESASIVVSSSHTLTVKSFNTKNH